MKGWENIGIVTENTVGTVHTTTIHLIPIWMVVAILAAILLPIWFYRKRDNSN